ncbi:unnamed protein product [Rotaria sp. Silwood1]|nr:unnamed protein product [Rotaria sp. Silwood1]CAF1130593.1 unnamed protein product [Rotaria sp. Silwood1]CAF3482938.1 unnamed protein product [Rotaria sp. Silwood1]CAF4587105.1 unnamed protein product [Rotaria sp. Silwood1]CAF4877743.1 unnamed protein product [Rotaria sp. Silwood1]
MVNFFQILIHNNKSSLSQLSYIWMSFGALMFFSSFLFLDWKFPILNLGYTFDTKLEQTKTTPVDEVQIKTKWYEKIYRRIGLWEHLTNPLYILVVLYLSFLLMPNILLSVTWYPWVYYINHNDKTISDKYTFAFNMASLSHIALCPIVGFLLSFRASRSTFPSAYIGRLIGVMWTAAGAITCMQYGLTHLTTDVPESWRAWVIVLALIVLMSCHLVQIWYITIKKFREHPPKVNEVQADAMITWF